MPAVTLTSTITAGAPALASEVQGNFVTLRNAINGTLDGDNLSAAAGQAAGINATGVTRRGALYIATEQTTTSSSYVFLTTNDRITNVVLPSNGLIRIAYQAQWKESVVLASRAAIFIGATQLKLADLTNAVPAVQEAQNGGGGGANIYKPLSSGGQGLTSGGDSSTPYTGDVTTGQVLGHAGSSAAYGFCEVFATAGTYTVGVQFKVASSGSVTVKERRLWVEAKGF